MNMKFVFFVFIYFRCFSTYFVQRGAYAKLPTEEEDKLVYDEGARRDRTRYDAFVAEKALEKALRHAKKPRPVDKKIKDDPSRDSETDTIMEEDGKMNKKSRPADKKIKDTSSRDSETDTIMEEIGKMNKKSRPADKKIKDTSSRDSETDTIMEEIGKMNKKPRPVDKKIKDTPTRDSEPDTIMEDDKEMTINAPFNDMKKSENSDNINEMTR